MKYLRWLLFPLSLIYGLVVIIRNWFYDAGVFKSHKFNAPVISIGNLDVGGAGKSPMTEYLISLFKNNYKLATLSRGYGRKTKGYLVEEAGSWKQEAGSSGSWKQEAGSKKLEAGTNTHNSQHTTHNIQLTTHNSQHTTHNIPLAAQLGDEPAQFKHKFPEVTVAVCENRVQGIKQLLPGHNLILLDDAYQHRAVEPGFSILLFDYTRLNEPQLLLPAGNLREPLSGRWRARVLIITKCPPQLTTDEQATLAAKVSPLPYQQLFFTSIAYQPLQDMEGNHADILIDAHTTIFLLTGIANPVPLVKYLNNFTSAIVHHKYPDHHPFTIKNISKLAAEYEACTSQKKIIIATEKDAQRLRQYWFKWQLPAAKKPPVFVIPIQIAFLNNSGPLFDKIITDYVREHTA